MNVIDLFFNEIRRQRSFRHCPASDRHALISAGDEVEVRPDEGQPFAARPMPAAARQSNFIAARLSGRENHSQNLVI